MANILKSYPYSSRIDQSAFKYPITTKSERATRREEELPEDKNELYTHPLFSKKRNIQIDEENAPFFENERSGTAISRKNEDEFPVFGDKGGRKLYTRKLSKRKTIKRKGKQSKHKQSKHKSKKRTSLKNRR